MHNLRWGVGRAMTVAAVFIAWAALVRALVPDWYRTRHVDLLSVIGLYAVGGLCVGVVVGLLRPWTRSLPGAIVVGFLASLAAAFAMLASFLGREALNPLALGLVLVLALVFGPVAGWRMRRDFGTGGHVKRTR